MARVLTDNGAVLARCLLLFTAFGFFTPSVFAQSAPTGAHYGGRTVDTGYGGDSSRGSGNYAASVPLEFPDDRAGLPIPLQVLQTGRGVGAAGLGWDVTISYIHRDTSLAHRRPQFRGNEAPQARSRLVLSLFGQELELVRRDQTSWVARDGTLALTVRELPGAWQAFDESGRTYEFATEPSTGLWLLTAIHTHGGAAVRLSYDITGQNAREVSLRRIEYNTEAASGCAKHLLELEYGPALSAPIGYSLVGEHLFARSRTLARIDVNVRATLGDSIVAACNVPTKRLKQYIFNYERRDVDSQLPRLSSVTMTGREGTPEANQPLLVAGYEYGAAVKDDTVRFERTQAIALPADADTGTIASSLPGASSPSPGSGERYGMWQTLLDMTGDGRPELVYKQGDKLRIAHNRPTSAGGTTIGVTGGGSPGGAQLHDSVFSGGPLDGHATTSRRLRYDAGSANTTDVWRRTMDVNGDGRIDIVDAGAEPKNWIVYLNTPGVIPGVDPDISWQRRKVSIEKLAEKLKSLGYELPDNNYIPLTRRISALTSEKLRLCLRFQGGEWRPITSNYLPSFITGVSQETDPATGLPTSVTLTWTCDGTGLLAAGPPATNNPACVSGYLNNGQTSQRGGDICDRKNVIEKTYTLWDLTDINGDGYPDFAFNDTAPKLRRDLSPLSGSFFSSPGEDPEEGATFIGEIPVSFEIRATKILAAFNVAGVRLANAGQPTEAFSSAVTFRENGRGVGVGLWEDVPGQQGLSDQQQQTGGLADVNGDGLVDWVHRQTAHLGDGRRVTDTPITLPGPMSVQTSNRTMACETGQTYRSSTAATLRDMTGDGTPDYVTKELWVGTGAGFAGPYAIDSDQTFSISTETESCDGGESKTTSGLFDIDGDGKADVVKLEGGSLHVWQLEGADSTRRGANVGRLTSVDNGYGAKTRITYRSAKEDASTQHQVAYPEIVVDTVATTGVHDLGGSIAETRYAYGDAQLYFDTAADAFRFYGYRRVVEMATSAGPDNRTLGYPTIVDNWGGAPPNLTSTIEGRWLRSRRVGRARQVLTLRGSVNANPWNLLSIDPSSPNVIGATQTQWDAKRFEGQPGGLSQDCRDIVNPYDWEASLAADGIDMCRAHGFGFVAMTTSWYGAAPPPSTNNLQTRSRAVTVDNFGRVISTQLENDLSRVDDDLCVDSSYAEPGLSFPRVLTALATRRASSCDRRVVLSEESFLYDNLAAGAVREGRVTAHLVDQRATDNGERLRQIRVFDAAYDAAGNLISMQTSRGGVGRTTTFGYDIFGVAPTRTRVTATNVPPMEAVTTYDLVSLQPKSVKDINGTEYGTDYDGFGRPTRVTVKPPGGELGVLATQSYSGFAVLSSGGRQIKTTTYPNPIPAAAVDSTPGQFAITYLDELGRTRFTMVSLGADYGAPSSVAVGARTYDDLGRISFQADPFPAGIGATAKVGPVPSFQDQYGTSYHYKTTGDIDCVIRGQGRQTLTVVGNLGSERLPTCFNRTQRNHVDIFEVRDAEALLPNSATAGVVRRAYSTAIGRVIERTTEKGGVRLESAKFTQDRLGQLTTMTRYLDPVAYTGGVRIARRMDSLGQALRLDEAVDATQFFTYSEWGEPVETRWQDGPTERRLVSRFDALGRLVSHVEFNNGVADPEAGTTYAYDTPIASDGFSPTFTLGRLTRAASPTSAVNFSYDSYGRSNGRLYSDDEGGRYIERMHRGADGSLELVEFNLPDNGFTTETVKYGYDSARRLREVAFDDRTGNRTLYQAREIDALGRVRSAKYGDAIGLETRFDDTGRRLLRGVVLHTEQGVRELQFEKYDALGRELQRTESKNAGSAVVHQRNYDALGRLGAVRVGVGAAVSEAWRMRYDPLGNIVQLSDLAGSNDAKLTYGLIDPDRVCGILYGEAAFTSGGCNVNHDATGNVVNKPTRTQPIALSYFNAGNVRTITQGARTAKFAYDAFGQVHKLDISGPPEAGGRKDRRYGAFLESHAVTSGARPKSVLTRTIPGTGARRIGAGTDWVFGFGELRGSRFFVDETGAFVQDVDYRPFGEAVSSGAPAGTPDYASEQWNGGDNLGALGLDHLGARLYDPTIGRFMSRDPLFVPRGASTTNAYAFALNDPINRADPSGLDPLASTIKTLWYTVNKWDEDFAKKNPGKNRTPVPHPPQALSAYAHVDNFLSMAFRWRRFYLSDSREDLGYALVSTAKFGAGFGGFWGNWVGLSLDLGLEVHERGWYTPYTWQEEYLEREWYFHLEMTHELKQINKMLKDIRSGQTTCVEASVCWREGDEPGYDYDGYDPVSTELPFGPVWMPNVSPAGPVQPQLGPWEVSHPLTQTQPQVSRPGGSSGGADPVIIGTPGGCPPGQCDRPN